MKDKFEYTLQDPLKVAVSGSEELSSEIVVNSPRPRDSNLQLELESYLSKCLFNLPNLSNKDVKEEDSLDKEDISDDEKSKQWEIIIMAGSDPTKVSRMIQLLSELLCSGNRENPQATINGTKFTVPIFNDLSGKDKKALLARYTYHFLLSDIT